jgi:hypothetical protein
MVHFGSELSSNSLDVSQSRHEPTAKRHSLILGQDIIQQCFSPYYQTTMLSPW